MTTVEGIIDKANRENKLFDEPEEGVTKTHKTQLIRKWGVVIFDLLMKQSVDMVGKGFK